MFINSFFQLSSMCISFLAINVLYLLFHSNGKVVHTWSIKVVIVNLLSFASQKLSLALYVSVYES
jgi:hypothetical protein